MAHAKAFIAMLGRFHPLIRLALRVFAYAAIL